MLRADNVSFAYGATSVLRGVSVAVPRGELLGIIGPNGAGKTTLLRLLAGMLQPSTGRVTLDGTDVSRLQRRHLARRMAIVPQETHLAFDYSVLELALMGRYPHLQTFELEGPDDLAIAREALAATGTAQLEHRRFMTLSDGEKQRVVIASALAQFGRLGPPSPVPPVPPVPDDHEASAVLLLDEPTASLDLGYQLEIATILKTLNRERAIAMLVSTHDLNFAAHLCRELVLLRDGHTVAAGPTEAVLTTESVERLYDVDAEVRHHEAAGHLTVVPLRRTRGEGLGAKR